MQLYLPSPIPSKRAFFFFCFYFTSPYLTYDYFSSVHMHYCYNNQTGSIILSLNSATIHKPVWRSALLKVLATYQLQPATYNTFSSSTSTITRTRKICTLKATESRHEVVVTHDATWRYSTALRIAYRTAYTGSVFHPGTEHSCFIVRKAGTPRESCGA